MRHTSLKLLTLIVILTGALTSKADADLHVVDGILYQKYDNSMVDVYGISNDIVNATIPSEVEIDGANCKIQLIRKLNAASDYYQWYYQQLQTPNPFEPYFNFGAKKLKSINIPASINVSGEAFGDCENLTEIIYPGFDNYGAGITEPCQTIDGALYSEDGKTLLFWPGGKTTVALPPTVERIGDCAFVLCSKIRSIDLKNIKQIGALAFFGCTSLKSLTIPASVTEIGNNAFGNHSASPYTLPLVILEGQKYNLLGRLPFKDVVLYKSVWQQIEDINTAKNFYFHDLPFSLSLKSSMLKGAKVTLGDNPYYKASGATYDLTCDYPEAIVTKNDKDYLISNIPFATTYCVTITTSETADNLPLWVWLVTGKPSFDMTVNKTQTTLTFKDMTVTDDETCRASDWGIRIDGTDYSLKGKEARFDNLRAGSLKKGMPYAYYGENRYDFFDNEQEYWTQPTGLIATATCGPTSAVLKASYINEDLEIQSAGWKHDESAKDTFILTGLTPGCKYTYIYEIRTLNPNETYTATVKFTTPALELKTLSPKCVSQNSAIVAATTNIAEEEMSAGFQWKKYDAPESLAPNEANAPVCDGKIEGIIKNLQPTSFYKVRAFYKDASNKYYYGDWITFDPSDWSFFEPTVRTYPVMDVSENGASLRGYALPGSDEITSQGFQYWTSNSSSHNSRASQSDIVTVEVSGQVMQTVIEGLMPDTEYVFRSFVETANGIYYGDEQSFTTLATSGISYVEAEVAEPTVVAYYNIYGRRLREPQPGINIVLYSDGSSKKILVR